jgi:hypothetical protein
MTVGEGHGGRAGEKLGDSDARAAAPADHAVVEAIPHGVGLATVFAVGLHISSPLLYINTIYAKNARLALGIHKFGVNSASVVLTVYLPYLQSTPTPLAHP